MYHVSPGDGNAIPSPAVIPYDPAAARRRWHVLRLCRLRQHAKRVEAQLLRGKRRQAVRRALRKLAEYSERGAA